MSGLRCAIQREEWEQLGDGPELHQTHYTAFPVTPSLFWRVLRDFPEHTLDLYRSGGHLHVDLNLSQSQFTTVQEHLQ